MASDGAFRYFREAEQQAFLKWRRLDVRERKRQALNDLSNVDIPAWKKRKLIREVVYYAGCSDYQPLISLSVYDYETETERISDEESYCFSKTSSCVSSPVASSSAEGATTGTTEEADESTTSSRSATPVESSLAESVKEPAPKSISLPSLGPSVESSLGQSASGAARKTTDLRSSEPVKSSTAESPNESTRKSISLPSLGPSVESSLGRSASGAARKTTDLRSSEPVKSSTAESPNESTRKSANSRTSGQSDSTVTSSVNETARKSTASSPTELDEESSVHLALPESVHETAHNFTTSQTTELVAPSVADSVNEEIDKASTLGTSELVDLLQEEDEFVTMEEWTTSEKNTPEKTRMSEDLNAEMLNLSSALSGHKIVSETQEESETGESVEDFMKNVPFFKHGNLHSSSGNSTISRKTIYTTVVSNEVTPSESSDHSSQSSLSAVLLVPSNVQPAMQELALKFAEIFCCRVMWCDASTGSFNERVSHVMVDLDVPEPMQFAQCQATGCGRYLVSMKWLEDSLEKDRILPQEPYEVIFCDDEASSSIVSPSHLARISPKSLFDGFAILMCKPFVNFNESLMKRLLVMNGARVCEHPRQLSQSPEQARVCIIDPQFFRKGRKSELLKLKSAKYKFVAVHYKWLFNSFLMYQLQPMLPYLHGADTAEALEAGVTKEFLEF